MKHLWEIEHPYYMTEGNYFSNDCHREYSVWDEYEEEWKLADLDYNWIIRWDWREGKDWDLPEYKGNPDRLYAQFWIQMVGQRKATLHTACINVCRNDEPAIIKFLERYWDYMKEIWEPYSLEPEE